VTFEEVSAAEAEAFRAEAEARRTPRAVPTARVRSTSHVTRGGCRGGRGASQRADGCAHARLRVRTRSADDDARKVATAAAKKPAAKKAPAKKTAGQEDGCEEDRGQEGSGQEGRREEDRRQEDRRQEGRGQEEHHEEVGGLT
jgi:hypothetical protein